MQPTLSVHAIGSEVTLGGQPALVTGVMLRGAGHVTYELTWWSSGCRNCQWVEACELKAPAAPQTIGFN